MTNGGGGDDGEWRFTPHYRRVLINARLQEARDAVCAGWFSTIYEMECALEPRRVGEYVKSLLDGLESNSPRFLA